MIKDAGDLIDRLRKWGTIEWARYGGGTIEDGVAVPPLVVWRFAEPRPVEFIEYFTELLNGKPREIKWRFDTSRRNWVLAPARIAREQAARHLGTDSQATRFLVDNDQAFCHKAVQEFAEIVNLMRL